MGFYYFSILSVIPPGIAYGVLLLLFWGIARVTRGMPGRKALLVVVGVVFLVLPVAEEFWIAWNFGQACKEAGTFIQRKVQVEGFYDDTSHWWRQLAESKYQFVESREYGTKKYWRVERDGKNLKHFAIDKPAARYHFKMPYSHTPVAHKITKHEAVVLDSSAGTVLAKYTRFSRDSPWFYVALGKGDFSCDAPRRWPLTRGSFSIYRDVLEPSVQR